MINTKVLSLTMVISMAITMLLSGCYYDDGPFLSFRSTKGRVANTWVFSYAEELGDDVTQDFENAFIQLSKNSSLVFDMGNGDVYTGTWSLSYDRKILSITYTDDVDSFEEIFIILRLKDDEMWLQQENGKFLRWELIPK